MNMTEIKSGKTAMPHITLNTALAVTAFLLRIPITRKRVYTQEFLASKRMTAKQAFNNGVLGQVTYAIHTEENPDHAKVVAAFNDEKLKIEEGRESEEFDVPPEVVARIACRVLFARKNFIKDVLSLVPFLRVRHAGSPTKQPTSDGGYKMTVPGFKDIRIDADEATRQHLGGK
jgi:hypothetical protein